MASFDSKGHDLFASLDGELVLDNDRVTLDRSWNRFVAAWFKGGKDDPNLQLIRLDPQRATSRRQLSQVAHPFVIPENRVCVFGASVLVSHSCNQTVMAVA